MARFDAELYLRLAGERLLLDGADPSAGPFFSPLDDVARALVAVDAVDAGTAQDVVDEYALAAALRSGRQLRLTMMRQARSSAPQRARTVSPRRVVPCDHRIEVGTEVWRIRAVTLAADRTAVSVAIRYGSAGRSHRGPTMMNAGGGPRQVTLVDDRGTAVSAMFSGGGSEHEWIGHFEARRPLAPDTAWVEVNGDRIELAGTQQACEVRVERLPEQDPALRHLWQSVATPGHFHRPPRSMEGPIEALVAAGAITADDPALAGVRAALDALHDRQATTGEARRMPEPWRSLLARRGRSDGPVGELTVGAVTPVFDGVSVGLTSLESDAEGFEIEVDVAGASMGRAMAPMGSSLDETQLAWWAADDRGNHYLGAPGRWSGSRDSSQGTIQFWPALDPKAARLDLMPTAGTSRAVISVPLRWIGPGAAAGA